ncbi:MAG: LacI family DNA-binding transcriptional regulator [Gloeobacteraceae cyanobacterium ES-bin-144]|nr:LacI family DNA-binding transcriptional regulator [Verrucomicrobiales bacterium]
MIFLLFRAMPEHMNLIENDACLLAKKTNACRIRQNDPAPEVNQQFIAEKLNISRATVSRCFTNHPGINPVTRARVFQLASEIGYVHLQMRSAKPWKKNKKTKKTFGVLICTPLGDYTRKNYQNPSEQTIAGVTECAHLNHAETEVHIIDPKSCELNSPDYFRIEKLCNRWEGVLLVFPFPNAFLDQLATKVSLVSLVGQFNHATIDCVDVDHHKGITAVVDHLHAHGHRRIGFFTRRYEVEACWSFRRYAAYVEAMARLRLPMVSEDLVNVFPSVEMDAEASIEYVARQTKAGVTAWVCAADQQAYDLIEGLEARGISVPGMVSITGFDGLDTPKNMPMLTTVSIPFREIGITGTLRLLTRVQKPFGLPHHVLIDCRLRPGETVGPARQ